MKGYPIAVSKEIFTVIDKEYWSEIQAMGEWGLSGRGYVHCKHKSRTIYLHIWVYKQNNSTYIGEVDHIDTNKLNNLKENLRPATRSQNSFNTSLRNNNSSGIKGVSWAKDLSRWNAYITIKGKRISLGYFDSIEEAAEVRRAAAIRYFGEFAREL